MTDGEHVYLDLHEPHTQVQTGNAPISSSAKMSNVDTVVLVLSAVVVVLSITVTVFICMYVKTKEGHAGAVDTGDKIRGAHTFVRWKRNSCIGTECSMIYYGYLAGANHLNGVGSGSNYLCLPHDPQLKLFPWYWNVTTSAGQLQGVEYELIVEMDNSKVPNHPDDKNVPCSLCLTRHKTTLMIPGRTSCYPGWSMEFLRATLCPHHHHDIKVGGRQLRNMSVSMEIQNRTCMVL